MDDHLPPGYEEPQPVSRVTLQPGPGVMVKPDPYCDRCGLVVAEWTIHVAWHRNLTTGIALLGAIAAGLIEAGGVTLPPGLAETLAWATARAETEEDDKPDDDDGGAPVPARPSPPEPPPVPPAERRPDPADVTT